MPWLWRLCGELSAVEWSLCLSSIFLLPIALIICVTRSKREKTSRLSLAEIGDISGEMPLDDSVEVTTSGPVTTINRPASTKHESRESQRVQSGSFLGQVTPRSVKLALRQLPPVPELNKSNVRQHSSYTESVVYDIVALDFCNSLPTVDSKVLQKQTIEGSNHTGEEYEEDEVVFPVYAEVNKTTVHLNSSRYSSLYAKVNKIGSRNVEI
ncbi:uncharacterized protein LOC105019324 [Esox lucius]|uniref:uncharacterized protein LOC105019324 n=1 Tax=Esox lucius TaxID=8010 RepID=UPI0005772927|nr:uncharacterized protein LOC105019324 [Esox lucius]